MKCFKRPLRRKHWAVHKFSSGLRASKEEKWALEITYSGRPSTSRAEDNVEKFEKKSTRIFGIQLTRSQKLQVWVGVLVSGFWPWIRTWDTLSRSLFPACSHRTKKHSFDFVPEVEKSDLKWPKLSFKGHQGRWKLVLWVRPWDQTSFEPTEDAHFIETEKQAKWVQVLKRRSLFFFSMFEESCIRNSFLLDILSIRNFTWSFWGNWERMCEENAQNCGDRVIGFSVMTTPQLTQLCLWCGIW